MSTDERLFTYDLPCVSNCCGVEVYCDTDICSDCKEHCLVVCIDDDTGEEFIYNDGDKNESKRT